MTVNFVGVLLGAVFVVVGLGIAGVLAGLLVGVLAGVLAGVARGEMLVVTEAGALVVAGARSWSGAEAQDESIKAKRSHLR